uniref:SH3 domain-containing protein n=1 Tax=Vannella robusta TaxID=1487602 RepID=A0A7S4HUS4_9EUKA|mmetsp:Transcript_15877/g.20210  ORF Transcript_15877/g.20210 Transcript_15877/m.20210 type:complete len:345 (+) Transcript_15877:62-1096(+)
MADQQSVDTMVQEEVLQPGSIGRSKTILTTVDKPYPADKVDSSKTTVAMVRASWDFDARDETELTFKKGDEIVITIQAEGGWWMGSLNGKEGKLPINRVLVIQTLEKRKADLKIDQKKVTSRIKALQRLVSRDNLIEKEQEPPKAPQRTSSPLAEVSPIGKRRRRRISVKLSHNKVEKGKESPTRDTDQESTKTQEELLEERREKRRLERERRQRAIELEQEAEKKQQQETASGSSSCDSSESSAEQSEYSSSCESSTESSTESTESTSEEESQVDESDREVSTGSDIDATESSSRVLPDGGSSLDNIEKSSEESSSESAAECNESESSSASASSSYESSSSEE